MLIDEVCDFLLPAAAAAVVEDVRVGLGYTAVRLDGGRCGLAYTFRDEIPAGCCVINSAGTLTGVPPGAADEDLLTELRVTSNDAVGMVGYFGPLIEPLRTLSKALHIFERRPDAGPGVLSEAAAAEILPECHLVILSATALLNRTLDDLLVHCRNAREVAILGPSTPLLPGIFADRGVTLLSGVHVMDAESVLRIVSEGGGTRQLRTGIRKLTLRCASR